MDSGHPQNRFWPLPDKADWKMEPEPEVFALDGLHCVVCHNLGQARRMLESGESFAVICVIAQGTEA